MTKAALYFHHLHFYVQDVAFWQDWFIRKLSFSQRISQDASRCQAVTGATLLQNQIEIRLSEPSSSFNSAVQSDVVEYLGIHPPGLADLAIATDSFDDVLTRAIAAGAVLTRPVSTNLRGQRECQLQGWADLRHTLIEVSSQWATDHKQFAAASSSGLCTIDHAVLNVPKGELVAASEWYCKVLGLTPGQHFDIATANSGLRSQVLMHPEGTLQIPINEPTSSSSQIQEFLQHNRGAGIQHVALRSGDAVSAIAHLRQQGVELISVPSTYYSSLHQRPDCPLPDTSAASSQQLLLDWAKGGKQGMLLQTFTKPIFAEPTFFFEVIERSTYEEAGQLKQAQGFGEGNFQALFEAIERSQMERSYAERSIL